MKKIFFSLVSLMMIGIAATAQAEIKDEYFSVAPFIGGYVFEGNENRKESATAGVRLGYNYTENLVIEGVFNYIPSELEDAPNASTQDVYGLAIEGLYHFMPDSKFVPFIALGIGGIHFGSPDNEWNNLALDYGVGLKYFIKDNIALRADARHILSIDNDDRNKRYNNLLVAFGIDFAFDSKKLLAKFSSEEPSPQTAPVAQAAPAEPAKVVLDSDKDGVSDDLDKCPNTPADSKANKDGCPMDSDADGVADYLDKCPQTAAGETVAKDGCVYKKESIVINIEFDTARSDIKKKYHDEIKKIADFMKKYPDTHAVIEGHTDNVDIHKQPERNIKLSQARADSVRKYLIENFGIAGPRITAIGYGPQKPVAGNDTPEGRQKNRRIVATIETVQIK